MKKLGKYEVLGELGHGAMGVVYRARDPIINRLVALKTITSGVADNPAMLERFYREAQSAGGLQHPNIVTIYDMGEAGSVPYIAMELVEGENLEQVIARRSALPVTLKLVYAIQACRALDYAHKRGIVHRDIKPGNVMVSKDGAVKVVDFGIARVLEASRTQTGMLIGTFAYMSPEQYHGEHADERSDIWSLGVMLYELLCYRRPFMGASPASLMNCICSDEPPLLSTLLEDCPPDLEYVVSRMLRKSPKERYQSMEDVVLDLDPVCDALRAKSVSALMEHSRQLFEEGGYTDSRDLLRQVLQVEPGNQQARALLEKANQGVKRLLNRPKVQQLVDKGKTFLSDGKLQEARSAAASALQLDSEFAPAEDLLQAIQAEVDRARILAEWFEAAKQNLAEGLPDEAEALLNKVLEAQPGNEQAQALLEQVRLEKIEGEKRRRLFDGLQQARELWTRQDYGGCVALLEDLGQEFPDEEEVLRLLETVREDQLEQQKQQDLLQSRDLLAAGRYEESLALLQRLQNQFPSDEEIPRLLEEVRQDQMAQRRLKSLAEARSFLTSGQYEECIACLTVMRASFPEEPEVLQLLQSAHQSQAEQIHQRGVNEATELLAARRFEDCSTLLAGLEQQFPGDAEILGLQKAVRDEQAEQARQHRLGEARSLLAAGRYDECEVLLHSLAEQSPEDGEVLRLQIAIREERLQQRRLQVLEEARGLLSARKYPQSVALLASLQQEFPEDEDTHRLLESASKEQADQQKRDGLSEANKLLAARKFDECIALLSKLQEEFPGESGIARLLEYARKGQAEQHLRAGLDQARGLLAERLYDQSIQLLSQLQTEFPGETEIVWLLATAREDLAEMEKQQKLAQARSLLAGRSFVEALAVLDGLEAAHPKDSAMSKLRLVVLREQEQQAKAEKVQHELEELKKLMSEKQYPQVIARTKELLTVFPGEANFIRLGEFARGRQATIEMDLLRQKTLERVQASMAAGRFETAAQIAKKGLKALPGNAELQGLLHEAETQQKKLQVRQEIEHRIREIRVKIVREELSEAISLAEKTLATLGPDTDLNHLLSSAQVELQSREQKRIREQAIETIRTLVESGNVDAATQMLGDAVNAETLPVYDPRVQRLTEMIEEAKRPAPEQPEPGPVPAAPIPAVPGLSKEYAFLQAAPLPSAPPGPVDSVTPTVQSPVSDRPTNRPQYVARAAPAQPPPPLPEIVLPSVTQRASEEEADISGIEPSPSLLVEPLTFQAAAPAAEPAVVPTEIPAPQVAPAAPRPAGRTKGAVAPKPAPPAVSKPAPPAVSKPAPPAASKFPPSAAPKSAPPAAPKAVARDASKIAPTVPSKVAPPVTSKVARPVGSKVAPPVASVPFYRRPIVLGAGALAIVVASALPFLIHKTSSPVAQSPAASSPVATQRTEQPARPAPDPVEAQQRQALNAADNLIAANDLNGAIQQLRPAALLKGPLTNQVTQKTAEIEESMKNAGLRDLRQREEKVWQRAIRNAAGGHFAEAQKEFKEVLALPPGGVHTAEAQQNLDKMLAQSKAQNALLVQGRQSLGQGDFSSARRAAEQLKQNGGDPAVLTAGIDRAEQVQLKQLENTFDQLKQRDDDTAMQQLIALQPKFQSLSSDGGPQSAEAANYANKISATVADIRSHSAKRSGDAAFDKLVQRSRQATTANDKSGLTAVRGDFQAIAQGGGPRADSAQQYVTDITKKLDVLNTPAAAPPPVQAPPPPVAATPPLAASKAPPSTALVDEPAVRSVVQSFFQGFEQRSPDALRQAWPGIPKKRYDAYKDSFANVSAISIQVVGENVKLGADGTTATVTVESVLVETPKSDSKQRRFSPGWTFQLSKSDNSWRITSVQ